jgi:hypothetical protein
VAVGTTVAGAGGKARPFLNQRNERMNLDVLGDRAAFLARSSLGRSVDLFSEHNLFVFFYSLVVLTRMRFKSIYVKNCNLASLISDQTLFLQSLASTLTVGRLKPSNSAMYS